MDRRLFLLKAFVIGVLGTSIGTVNYNSFESTSINVPIWFTIVVFASHFQTVLLLWLAFDGQMRIRKWVLAGSVGSLCYAILFWVFGELALQETAKVLVILKQFFIGGLSAIPIWIALKVYYSKAYLWIVANAIGYAFLEFYIANINLITSIGIIRKILNHSFLTLQVVLNGNWVIAYGLFGLILGIFLFKIIENGRIEMETRLNA